MVSSGSSIEENGVSNPNEARLAPFLGARLTSLTLLVMGLLPS